MAMLTLTVLSASLVLCTAQLGVTQGPLGLSGLLGISGPLDSTTGTGTGTGTGSGTGTGNTNAMGQLFSNPLMSLGLTGGENPHRALLMPLLSSMGGSNVANYYYLRGGMDKYANVMMSDMLGKMFAQSMGMDPMLAAIFAGQMTDAPDNYALNNMLFNNGGLFSRGGATGAGGNPQGQGSGLLPAGAASPFQQPSPLNNMLLGSLAFARR